MGKKDEDKTPVPTGLPTDPDPAAKQPPEPPKSKGPAPTVGRIVHYCVADGVRRPAVVVSVDSECCSLQVFLQPMDEVYTHVKPAEAWAGMAYRSGVKEGPHPLQWSWPPKV